MEANTPAVPDSQNPQNNLSPLETSSIDGNWPETPQFSQAEFAQPVSSSVETSSTRSDVDALQEALKHGHIEAGILERNTPRESKFRLLKPEELTTDKL